MAETAGMLILAADFLGDKTVGKAERIKRISKASIPILFVKTKTGGYLGLNPSSVQEIKVPITSLVELADLKAFVDNKDNLDVNRVYKKLTQLKINHATLKGGFAKNDLPLIHALLDAQRVDGNWDFKLLPSLRSPEAIKTEVAIINDAIYDKKRLTDEINKRITIIDEAFKGQVNELKQKLQERKVFWTEELKRIKSEETKKIKEREAQLNQELKQLEKEVEKQKAENLKGFVKGVAKNIRKDEKDIEKFVLRLEELTQKPSDDPVTAIESILQQLDDATDTFKAAIAFAKSQVNNTRNREADIAIDYKLTKEDLEKKCEADKQKILMEYSTAEQKRDAELRKIESDLKVAQNKYSEFIDRKDGWIREIERQVETESAPMVEPERFKLDTKPAQIELHVPIYIFQYENKKGTDVYTLAIPPLRVPSSLKKLDKNGIYGKHKAIFYYPLHERIGELVEWIPRAIEKDLPFRNAIDALPNMVDQTVQMREAFYNAKQLFVNTLQLPEKSFRSAADRLSADVIA